MSSLRQSWFKEQFELYTKIIEKKNDVILTNFIILIKKKIVFSIKLKNNKYTSKFNYFYIVNNILQQISNSQLTDELFLALSVLLWGFKFPPTTDFNANAPFFFSLYTMLLLFAGVQFVYELSSLQADKIIAAVFPSSYLYNVFQQSYFFRKTPKTWG